MSDLSGDLGSQVKNAVLIYSDSGLVWHKFVPESEARDFLDKCTVESGSAVMFATKEGMDVELYFEHSPDLRHNIEVAKSKLRHELRIKAALDKHGVPQDRNTRIAVVMAIRELYG